MEALDPWLIELIVVRATHSSLERLALSPDVKRGLLVRLRRGVYVERSAFAGMTPEEQHIVRMRALAAVASSPIVFSHASAALVHGLPVIRPRLVNVHVTVTQRNERGQEGVTGHLLPLRSEEVEHVGGLLVTTAARTVADLATSTPIEEGIMAADAALRLGLPRVALEAAADLLAGRQGLRRLDDVIVFAHPGADSAAESRSRWTLFRLGIEPAHLQYRVVLLDGSERHLDMLFPSFRVGGEVDGAVKLLDAAISKDARKALLEEKRREDAIRLQLRGFARWGWAEAISTSLLGAVLRQVGVVPASCKPSLADYGAVARAAKPRRRFVQR